MTPDKYYLNLAGEYRVAAELLKREIFATITYGNKKGADIYAIGPNRKTAIVEVKASNSSRFVTGLFQRYRDEAQEHRDFWVLYRWTGDLEQYFVLTHDEMAIAQAERNLPGQDDLAEPSRSSLCSPMMMMITPVGAESSSFPSCQPATMRPGPL